MQEDHDAGLLDQEPDVGRAFKSVMVHAWPDGRFLPWLCGKSVMEIHQIDEPIAQRKLTAGDDIVLVTIGKPALFDDGEDYYCPYSIEFRDKKKLGYAGGMDAVQAIQLVMKKIGTDLAHIGRKANTPISWLPDTLDETGFPL